VIEVEVEFFGRLADGVLKPEVEDIVGEMGAHEKLSGQIVDTANILL
jgi:hypothetical protein